MAEPPAPNVRTFSGEPSERSERPERRRGRRVRITRRSAMNDEFLTRIVPLGIKVWARREPG
jgi:hypothetical protein